MNTQDTAFDQIGEDADQQEGMGLVVVGIFAIGIFLLLVVAACCLR